MKYVPTPTKLKHFKNVLRLKSSKSVIKNIQPRPQIILSYKKKSLPQGNRSKQRTDVTISDIQARQSIRI